MFEEKPEDTPEDSEAPPTDNSEDESEGPEETPDKAVKSSTKSTVFFKEEDIPEDQREALGPTLKKMQASHTRKMQQAARVVHKAAAFDELTNDPAFKEWVASQNGAPNKKEPDDNSDASNGDGAMRALIREEIERAIGPIKEESTTSKRERAQAAAERAWDKLKEDHPDCEEYREEMAEYNARYPNLSYEDLYKLASRGDVEAKGGKKVLDSLESKKRANVGRPTGQAPKGPPPQAKTVQEAAAQARAELLRKGG